MAYSHAPVCSARRSSSSPGRGDDPPQYGTTRARRNGRRAQFWRPVTSSLVSNASRPMVVDLRHDRWSRTQWNATTDRPDLPR